MTPQRHVSRRTLLRAGAAGAALAATPYFSRRSAAATTLNVIMIADPWVNALSTLGPQYQKESGTAVNVASYPYDQTHQKEVLLGTQKSDAADVVVLDSPWVGEFAEAGIVDDLKPRIDAASDLNYDDFFKTFRDVANWKGQIIGLPFAPYYVMLHYRKDLFQAEGVKVPKTYDEWKTVAEHFTNNAKYPGMHGVGMNNQKGSPVGQAWFEYIWNFGGKPFASNYPDSTDQYADMKPMFDSQDGIGVVQLFKDMLKYEPPGSLNMAWDERAQAFATGKIAMFSGWSVRTPLLIDPKRSQVGDKFAVAVVPAAAGHSPVPPLGGWVMGINSYSKNKDEAWKFILWLTSARIHKQFINLGGPAARYSELKDPELAGKFWWFPTIEESEKLAFADCRPRVPESFQIIDTTGNNTSDSLSGGMSPADAMKKTNDDIKNLLQGAGYNMS